VVPGVEFHVEVALAERALDHLDKREAASIETRCEGGCGV
jgi:hypothetical protein